MIKKSDKEYIKSLVEKYGTECVANALLEYTYRGHDFSNQMQSGGQKEENRGAKGLKVVIPSFLLCTLISPPTAFLFLLGAVTNRMCAKWHEQENVPSALNTLSWAEYIATGNYKKDGDKNYFSNNKTSNTEEATRRSSENPDVKDVLNKVTKDELSKLSLSEKEKLAFKYWYITFDNGEVFKVMAYDKENAEAYGKAIIKYPLMIKRYKFYLSSSEQYKKYMKEDYDIYRVIYDDGQVLYDIGKNENEAIDTGDEMVKKYAKAYDEAFKKSKVNTNPFIIPSIIRVEKQKDLSDIQYPKKMMKVSIEKPIVSRESTNSKTDLFWEELDGGHFWQYSIVFYTEKKQIFRMNLPCPRGSESEKESKNYACGIIKNLIQSVYGDMLRNNDSNKWYECRFKDGDCYYICSEDSQKAENIALKTYSIKSLMEGYMRLKDENRKAFYKGLEDNRNCNINELKKENYPNIPSNIKDIHVIMFKQVTSKDNNPRTIINKKLGDFDFI